jgi:hypothetical protein
MSNALSRKYSTLHDLQDYGYASIHGSGAPNGSRLTPEEYLELILQQVGQRRLLVSQAHEVIEVVQAGGKSRPELEHYIQARAQDSMRGRLYAPKTIEIREAILALQAGYEVMTVRQIFYRLMTQKIVPKSEKEGYRPIQRQVLQLRRQGFLPWSFIADATRWVRQPDSWDSTDSFLSDVSRTYRRDRWRSQGVRIEIWLEIRTARHSASTAPPRSARPRAEALALGPRPTAS